MDDPPSFRYQEVVRKKTEREALNTYECEECRKCMDALLQDDAEGVFQRRELMCASRHRARHPKPPTFFGN
jgi:Na+-translocating ferredoxin:NAD+ oxidoreductase RnfC subunit